MRLCLRSMVTALSLLSTCTAGRDELLSAEVGDRVALLTGGERGDANGWCMGLLVAPDAMLTYAHCAKAHTLQWAFFGNSEAEFNAKPPRSKESIAAVEVKLTPIAVSSSSSASGETLSVPQPTRRLLTEEEDASAGDADAWVAVTKVVFHPDYVEATSTPTMDLAVVILDTPRPTPPFALAANIGSFSAMLNKTAGYFVPTFQAFELNNAFVKKTQTSKLFLVGALKKVPWSKCAPAKILNAGSWVSVVEPLGQVCAAAATPASPSPIKELVSDMFVMLDGKLAALSVAGGNDASAGTQTYMFLSEQARFITEATQKQDQWRSVRMVVGGTAVPSLQGYVTGLRESKTSENFCLGSLIAPSFILTAAHCVQGKSFDQVSVGSLYSSGDKDGEQMKIKTITVHPKFEASTFSYDFAIIELQYTSIQTPITLYNGDDDPISPGNRLTMYGYGQQRSSEATRMLQYVDLPVVDKKECKTVLQPKVLDASMMCAGGEDGKDACQGESGGPLVLKSSAAALVAMVSYGRGCGIKGMPAVYAVVSEAADFINEHVYGHRWVSSTTKPSGTTSPSPTPSPTRGSSSPAVTPATRPPASPASPSTPSQLPPTPSSPPLLEEGRSMETDRPSSGSISLQMLATTGNWTAVESIDIDTAASHSLVVDGTYAQTTRDSVATALLVPALPALASDHGLVHSLSFYSTADLSRLASLIAAFDKRSLRRRPSRFHHH